MTEPVYPCRLAFPEDWAATVKGCCPEENINYEQARKKWNSAT